jgi:hypothetical protein
MAPNQQLDVVILADARGALYATCGVLPRKKIVIPREFLEAGLRHLKPTFRAGPVLTLPLGAMLKPALPEPQIEGMQATFVHSGGAGFTESPLAPQVPIGELPIGRALLTDGWVRMFREDDAES